MQNRTETTNIRPGWYGSVDWVLPWELKGHLFDSQSGHMPGLWVWSLVRGCTGGNWSLFLSHIYVSLINVFLSLAPPPSSSLSKINKHILEWGLKKERLKKGRKETNGMERKGKERKGKERKGKERKGKERKGKERKGKRTKTIVQIRAWWWGMIFSQYFYLSHVNQYLPHIYKK